MNKTATEIKYTKIEAGEYTASKNGKTIRITNYPYDQTVGFSYWAYEIEGFEFGRRTILASSNGEYERTLKECKKWAEIALEDTEK